MSSVPVDVMLGIYLGILTGIIPGLVAWALGFLFKYTTGVTIPGFGVVALALALAGVNGGLLAISDPVVRESTNSVVLISAIMVVLMLSLYAHNRGDAMGATFPKRVSLRGLRNRTLSTDVIDLVGGRGRVRVEVSGDVVDMEGYPAMSEDLRADIRNVSWTFPADIPLSELESRVADRLRTEFDLADVAVSLDETARATVVAAPPLSAFSKRVPAGMRAVSVETLVPTGVARGDEVAVVTAEETVHGTIVSARSAGTTAPSAPPPPAIVGEIADRTDATADPSPRAPTTTGGEGRVTVAVPRADAAPLLAATDATVLVRSRGTRREYELLSVLRRAGRRFRKFTVGIGSSLDGVTLGGASVRDRHDVAVLAVRQPDGWLVAPHGTTELTAGDDVFAVGTPEALERFTRAVG